MPKKKITNFNEEFDLKLFVIIAKNNFYLVIIFMLLGFSISYLYLRYTPNFYQCQSVIKIDVINNANAILNIGGGIESGSPNSLAGNIELIHSRVIIGRALKQLPLQVSYFSKGTVLTNELYTRSPYRVEFNLMDSGLMDVPIYIEFEPDNRVSLTYFYHGKNNHFVFRNDELIQLPEGQLNIQILDYVTVQANQSAIKKETQFFIINSCYSRVIGWCGDCDCGTTIFRAPYQSSRINEKLWN